MIRVSTEQTTLDALAGINTAYNQVTTSQQQLETGYRINQPSDDPAGTTQALQIKTSLLQLGQFQKNINSAQSFMNTSDTALGQINTLLDQAKSIAVQGGSNTLSSDQSAALAAQIQGIMDQVAELGNTMNGTQYVFGGQMTNQPPFVSNNGSYTYNGGTSANNSDQINVDFAPGQTMQINVSGESAIQPIFGVLSQLKSDLQFGNASAISNNDISAIDSQLSQVESAQADVGAKLQTLSSTSQYSQLEQTNYQNYLSQIMDTNMAQAVVTLQSAQTAYQAALAAASNTFQQSLLNYIK